jgi:DnaJ-domain-containing protein 1
LSIGRRLFDMARAELNSLLERAGRDDDGPVGGPDPDEDLYRRYGLDELTDAQLEAELERRRRSREAVHSRVNEPPPPRRPPPPASPRVPTRTDEIRRSYAALEVPYGSDFETVRKAYRTLMRKYHPDRQGGSADKQKAANELASRLTEAYRILGRHLRK